MIIKEQTKASITRKITQKNRFGMIISWVLQNAYWKYQSKWVTLKLIALQNFTLVGHTIQIKDGANSEVEYSSSKKSIPD